MANNFELLFQFACKAFWSHCKRTASSSWTSHVICNSCLHCIFTLSLYFVLSHNAYYIDFLHHSKHFTWNIAQKGETLSIQVLLFYVCCGMNDELTIRILFKSLIWMLPLCGCGNSLDCFLISLVGQRTRWPVTDCDLPQCVNIHTNVLVSVQGRGICLWH